MLRDLVAAAIVVWFILYFGFAAWAMLFQSDAGDD